MKHFNRTNGGKALLFILCVLTVVVFGACVLGAVGYLEAEFYTRSYASIVDDFIGTPEQYVNEWGNGTTEDYNEAARLIALLYNLRYAVFGIGVAAFAVGMVALVLLLGAAGRRPGDEELHLSFLAKLPGDAADGGLIIIMVCLVAAAFEMTEYAGTAVRLAALAIALIVDLMTGILVLMDWAVRIKAGTLLNNTLCWRCMKLVWRCVVWCWNVLGRILRSALDMVRNLTVVKYTVAGIAGICAVELLLMAIWNVGSDAVFLWFLEKLILVPAILWTAISLRKLEKAGQAMAAGELDYYTDPAHMLPPLRRHAENLNSIAVGMGAAVEDRLKSERMKTELITNVSHDLKTPLTNIVNYTGLIAAQSGEDPQQQEYCNVLLKQSEKLRRLIDDLVEASKASTGNLEVSLVPTDACVFITQADGEYSEKLQKAELSLVTRQPESPVHIMADGRRMWRIFDNLMNNAYKYAQPGTRVYLSLERGDKDAVITFRNTSREALDIAPDELLERFVRGDSARNTEGNGLGLSIAKSLAELQGGSFELQIDGDLFKVVMHYPLLGA